MSTKRGKSGEARARMGWSPPQSVVPHEEAGGRDGTALERSGARGASGTAVRPGPITYVELRNRLLAQHQAEERTIRTLRERLAYSISTFGHIRVRECRVSEFAGGKLSTFWTATIGASVTVYPSSD